MKNELRCVVDTNVLISAALLERSTPRRALARLVHHGVLLFSEETFDELETRIFRGKFDRYLLPGQRERFCDWLRARAIFVEVEERITASPDPSDDKFLAVAVNGAADYLITGDRKHLRSLGRFRRIPILLPAEFLKLDLV